MFPLSGRYPGGCSLNCTELQYPAPYAIEDGYLGYRSRQPKGREAFVRLCNFFPFVQSQVLCDNGLEKCPVKEIVKKTARRTVFLYSVLRLYCFCIMRNARY